MKYATVTDFSTQLKSSFLELKSEQALTFGYISPGHGFKGRQQWINDDSDLDEMYEVFHSKKEILIWCLLPREKPGERKSSKRGAEKSDCDKSSKKCKETQKNTQDDKPDVSDLIKQLKEKHGNKFSIEQYNAWAQLVRLGKHASLDAPPNYPFFVGRHKTKSSDANTTNSCSQPSTGSFSPGKRIKLRTELLDQIKKLSELLDNGDISQDQYDTMKLAVMNDITKM